MSLPFYKITCSACDFRDSYSYGKSYSYKGREDRKPQIDVGWCSECDSIGNFCTAFTKEYASRDLNMYGNWLKISKGFFAKFSKDKQNLGIKASKMLDDIHNRLAYFDSIDFANSCLSCGGTNIFKILLPEEEYLKTEQAGIKHSCGGDLLASMEGRFFFGHTHLIIYNEEGKTIK